MNEKGDMRDFSLMLLYQYAGELYLCYGVEMMTKKPLLDAPWNYFEMPEDFL